MSREFNFIENYETNGDGITNSKIELIENGTIISSIVGINENDSIYNLHKAWVYPNRRYTIVDGVETFEELI